MNDSIVIYRSKMEQMQDEYWMSVMENNPEIVFWSSIIFFGFFILIFLLILFPIIKSFFFSPFGKRKRRF